MAGFLKSLFGSNSAPEVSPAPEPIEPASYAAHIPVTDDKFDELVRDSRVPVLVDFWASWCGPCRMMAPTVDELASAYGGRVVIARVNVDENIEISGMFDISSVPTQVIFDSGQELVRHTGFATRRELEERLDDILSGNGTIV